MSLLVEMRLVQEVMDRVSLGDVVAAYIAVSFQPSQCRCCSGALEGCVVWQGREDELAGGDVARAGVCR